MRYQNFIYSSSNPLWSHIEEPDCSGAFRIEFKDTVELEKASRVVFKPIIESDFLKKAIKEKDVSLSVVISSPSTYEFSNNPIGFGGDQNIDLENHKMFGKIFITMIAYTNSSKFILPKEELHGIYANTSISFKEGAIIGISNEIEVTKEPEPQPLDVSFFELELSKEVDPETYQIDLSGDSRVIIKAGELLYKQLDYNRGLGQPGEMLNLASVYMPAMVSILYELREDNSAHNEKAWLNGLILAVPNFETYLQTKEYDPLEIAQDIFQKPFISTSKLLDYEA